MYGSALLSKSYLYFTHYGSVLYFRVLPDCIELFYVFLRFSICVLLLCIPFFKFMFVHCFVGYVKTSFDKFSVHHSCSTCIACVLFAFYTTISSPAS